jgi:hypothetical protein
MLRAPTLLATRTEPNFLYINKEIIDQPLTGHDSHLNKQAAPHTRNCWASHIYLIHFIVISPCPFPQYICYGVIKKSSKPILFVIYIYNIEMRKQNKNYTLRVVNVHCLQRRVHSVFSSELTEPIEQFLCHWNRSRDQILSVCLAQENR